MWTSSSHKYGDFIGPKMLIVGRCLGLEAVQVPDSLSSWAVQERSYKLPIQSAEEENSDSILEIRRDQFLRI